MSPARKTFVWVFLVCLALGVLLGVVKLVAPDAASVRLNGEEVTGMTALLTASGLGGGFGLLFGLIGAGLIALVGKSKA